MGLSLDFRISILVLYKTRPKNEQSARFVYSWHKRRNKNWRFKKHVSDWIQEMRHSKSISSTICWKIAIAQKTPTVKCKYYTFTIKISDRFLMIY